jgi:hypothetical protein
MNERSVIARLAVGDWRLAGTNHRRRHHHLKGGRGEREKTKDRRGEDEAGKTALGGNACEQSRIARAR